MRVRFPGRILERHVGGNTTYARALAEGLKDRGHDVDTLPVGPHPVLTMVAETAAGLRPAAAGSIVHYSADTGPLVPTIAPSVVTVHGVASRWIDVARTARQEAIWRSRVRRAIRSTKGLVTVSNSAALDIEAVFNIPREDIAVIHHGIDHEHFERPRELSDDVAAALPARDFLLFIANIEPRKNIGELIRAAESLASAEDGLPLVIAGKPAWNFDEILGQIRNSSAVTYLGFVSDNDRVALMQRCTAFVFPSLYEGFGFPVLEAMAAGAPVISSRRGSLAEVAGPAWVIEDTNAGSIADAIRAALNDRQWLAAAPGSGSEWAAQFSWDTSVDSHIEVYERVLGAM